MEKARWPVLVSDALKGSAKGAAGARPRGGEEGGNAALVAHLLELAEDRNLAAVAAKDDDVKMELVFKAELRKRNPEAAKADAAGSGLL